MPAVTRQGDLCTGHPPCFEPRPPSSWSPNVFVNSRQVIRVTDSYPPHGIPPCLPHSGNLADGSPNVFVNDLKLGRIGDPLNCGSLVQQGSGDVFAN